MSQTKKTNIVCSHLCVQSEKAKFIEKESQMVGPGAAEQGKRGDAGPRVQTSSYKTNKFWGSNVQCDNYS